MFLLTVLPLLLLILILIHASILVMMHGTLFIVDTSQRAAGWIADAFHLTPEVHVTNARFILPSRLPDKCLELPVLNAFKRAVVACPRQDQKIMTLQEIWNPSIDAPMHRAFHEALGLTGGKQVLLRIDYTVLRSKRLQWPERVKACIFYRLMGLEDPFMFPPYPVSRLIKYQPDLGAKVQRATLVLQHMVDNRLKRQFSCVVTRPLALLAGPRENYGLESAAGYQLDPMYIFVLLEKEISDLLQHARGQLAFDRLESGPTSIHRKVMRARQILALRLRIMSSDNRVRVIDLDRYMPF